MITPIEWEISKEKWRTRYRQYLPTMLPTIVIGEVTVVFVIAENFNSLWAWSVFGLFHCWLLWYMVSEYRSLPHRYQLFDDGIIVQKGGLATRYSWTDFTGYTIAQEAEWQPGGTRLGKEIVTLNTNNVMRVSQSIFGTNYQLIRRDGFWSKIWPLAGSVVVATEPDVQAQVDSLITSKLLKIPFKKLQGKIITIVFIVGLVIAVLVMAFFVYKMYSALQIIRNI